MKKVSGLIILFFLLVSLILKPAVLLGDDLQSLLNKARKYYSTRENGESLENAIKTSEEALKIVGNDDKKAKASIYVELSKYHFKLGEHHVKDNKSEVFFKGIEYAQLAISLDQENAGGYYWKAANLGRWGETNKFGFLARRSEFEDALKEVIARDRPYDYWGADRTLAAYYIPRVLFWGDRKKAIEHIEMAVKGEPAYLWNLMIQAEVYQGVDKDKSEAILQSILKQDINQLPDARFENMWIQEKAKSMNQTTNHP
ncbi:MAG TPA: tetratricopeptide repeat protein [Candidatus Brocadiia bacterium]|nr:TRAP transporter TatT component family protein [Candidatus Brocadiales bacterium]